MSHSGSCLCGSVKVTVKSKQDSQIICHCTDCQQTSGSNHSTNILPNQSDVVLKGNVKEYNYKVPSGNTVTRLFCGNCGSALGHKSKAFGDAMAIQTGNLPDFRKIPFNLELFTKDRWVNFPPVQHAEQAWTMPGAPGPKAKL
ncbi:uncharacterized protein L201_001088 [Kwoniella dendrophila CBS 6074]|uniref:CENP-V/GFA domain-containing protein n=1 Tax=Kwoniella dendrophila CBS 6074 TaxID=1295534 RepID=A0AAX4JLE5_9TREE